MSNAIKAVSGSLGIGSGLAGKQPKTIRPRDIINNILGVTTKEVKDANGNIQIVTDWVLTPEEEERMTALENSYDQWLTDLQSLSEIESAINDPAYQPVVTALRDNQRAAREEAYNTRTSLEEDELARRGLADSRASTQLREARGADFQKQITMDENNLTLMAEELRNQQFQRTTNSLNFAANSLFNEKMAAVNQGNANAGIQSGQFAAENSLAQSQWQARLAQQQQIFKNIGGLATSAAFAGAGGLGGGGAAAGGGGSLFGSGMYAQQMSSPGGTSFFGNTQVNWN